MKNKTRTTFILFFSTVMLLTLNAFAADDFSVLKIDTLIMEKGSLNYSLTIKAFVKNNGEPDDFAVTIAAIDGEGFELENITLTGFVKKGQTKVLVDVIKVPRNVYEQIAKWEWKK
ncbi:MAG: hypothetical protein HF978_04265 [Desulfobacteraceae bacterium]|nr:hypothetical protein [Desulfobacteraceae bacterium]MBC2754742.1 hypothetical protein [Desulfobacteraceae bacterium]